MTTDQSQDFLDSLPELGGGERFQFKCGPSVPCFNACCSDLTLMLTPYDALRLRKGLEIRSRDFIQRYCGVGAGQDIGFPLVRLRMLDDPGQSCPFVRPEGCSIYPDRPGACRTYPLGRASKLDENGELSVQFFIVQEDHCKGFEQDAEWTSDEWLADQGLEEYNEANDSYMRLMNRWRDKGAGPLDSRQVNMAFLALYQPDDFQRFIKDMGVFKRVDLDAAAQEKILSDEEAALGFALQWLSLVLLGEAEGLEKK